METRTWAFFYYGHEPGRREIEEDKIIEELADIFEVLRATGKVFGLSMNELEIIANKKTEKKGGFEAGVLLVDTTEASLINIIDSSGEPLLINNISTEKSNTYQRIRKSKPQQILFGVDNSITLPYILGMGKSKSEEVNAPVNLYEIEGIKIAYNNKGIKIKFIKKREIKKDDKQLDLFGNTI